MTQTENTMILSTIPYDEGWRLTIDGKEVEYYKTLDALIAFNVEDSGEHTVELKYEPSVYRLGLKISIIGICLFIFICIADTVLKKTFFKQKCVNDVHTYWILEDNDGEFPNEATSSIPPKNNKLKKLIYKFKQKNAPEKEERE